MPSREEIFNYDTYDKVLDKTLELMKREANSEKANELREMNALARTRVDVIKKSYISPLSEIISHPAKFVGSMEADIRLAKYSNDKGDLLPKIGVAGVKKANVIDEIGTHKKGGSFPYTPIKGDKEFLYYYDMWSNIAWGYINSSSGFNEMLLQTGNTLNHVFSGKTLTGDDAVDDRLSVEIGMNLFEEYGFDIESAGMKNMIYDRRLEYKLYTTRMPPDKLEFFE